jgi:hypothetical protein
MVLNDITNDSVATGAESDIYRASNEGMQKKYVKMFKQCARDGWYHQIVLSLTHLFTY